MACFEPLIGYYGKVVNPETGKRPLVFDVRKSFDGRLMRLPCGECIGCRLSHSLRWAVRCTHEKRMHRVSSFVTLTYDNEHLPPGSNLVLRDLQLFMKRLRKARGVGLRYFACGEYGDTFLRPHYHILLLNECFPDMRFWKKTESGHDVFVSEELRALWSVDNVSLGHSVIGECTPESISYCTQYVLKKVGHRGPVDRTPEFVTMSRRPGLGLSWFEKYHIEAYAHESAIIGGREVPLPRYYDDKYSAIDSDRLAELKVLRQRKAEDRWIDNTRARRMVRERVEQLKSIRFARDPLI